MSIVLPGPVDRYFEAANRGDRLAMATMFAASAVVQDEGQAHAGSDAIRFWLIDVEERYHPRYRLQAAETDGNVTTVSFLVSGTFPGSPAMLRQAFTVEDGLIAAIRTL